MGSLVSVVVTSFNRAQFIGETLQSVIDQTYVDWECLVVDDGSTDSTADVVGQYAQRDKRIKFFQRPSSRLKGANACRNYGFELSKGEFVNWLDDDDLFHPEKLERQLKSLQNTGDDFAVCPIWVFTDSITTPLRRRSKTISSKNNFESYLKTEFSWLTHAPLWRRSFLEQAGLLFDEELQASQEWEFYMRVLQQNPKIHFTDEPLVYSRVHAGNVSSNEQSSKKVWNYFLSRYKVYSHIGNRMSREQNTYLRSFMLARFQESLVFGYHEQAAKIYSMFIKNESTIPPNSKRKYFFALYTFRFLGKGNVLINDIKSTY